MPVLTNAQDSLTFTIGGVSSSSPVEACAALAASYTPRSDYVNYTGGGSYQLVTFGPNLYQVQALPGYGPFGACYVYQVETVTGFNPPVSPWTDELKNYIGPINLTKATIPRFSNPPRSSCPNAADPAQGNPIYPLRGVKREVVDTGVRIGRVNLTLTYDSSRLVPQGPSNLLDPFTGLTAGSGVVGSLWSSNLHRRIGGTTVTSAGVAYGSAAAQVSRGNGIVISLSKSSTGQFTPEANVADAIVSISGGGLRYYDRGANTQENYDGTTGNLSSVSWDDGQSVALTYSNASTPAAIAPAPGYLIQAADNAGRSVSFTYVARTGGIGEAQIGSITDAAGKVITLAYDASSNLASIHWPDGKVRMFLYENNTVGALTGVVDELGARYATFGYDAGWRATSSQHAGGADAFSVSYTTPPSILITEQYVYDGTNGVTYRYKDWILPQGTVIVDPLGSTSTWTATSLLNKNYLGGQSQAAGSGCAASTSSQTYDANGNVASKDDFNGSRVCYANDLSRNLETARVEGLANTTTCSTVTAANAALPTGSRKLSTTWHPDWRLETVVAEPGRLTTSVYNGQPDPFNGNAVASCAPSTALLPDGKPIAVLCKRVEQATTDVDGHLGFSAALQSGVANRVQQWTYNAYGQVLTAKDPLNHTTTYAYYADTSFTGTDPNAVGHTLGDLQTVTNAAGQVTTYGSYDKHGNVLQSSDPNGVATVNTYDLRQRLLSTSVGGQTTSYTYDPAGQLLKVTAPDASWIGYEYDPAHRMVATKDHLGNRIEYTLDNAGNRTAETVKDTTGALRRQLARSIDALGRVQQTTGRE